MTSGTPQWAQIWTQPGLVGPHSRCEVWGSVKAYDCTLSQSSPATYGATHCVHVCCARVVSWETATPCVVVFRASCPTTKHGPPKEVRSFKLLSQRSHETHLMGMYKVSPWVCTLWSHTTRVKVALLYHKVTWLVHCSLHIPYHTVLCLFRIILCTLTIWHHDVFSLGQTWVPLRPYVWNFLDLCGVDRSHLEIMWLFRSA